VVSCCAIQPSNSDRSERDVFAPVADDVAASDASRRSRERRPERRGDIARCRTAVIGVVADP
jgi:hypothetical protein